MKSALALICMAGAATAQSGSGTFGLPVGCTAYLTVQDASCQVDHHFTCDGDQAGHQRRVSLDEQGITYAGEIDAEAQWIASYHALTGHSEALMSNPVDPSSLSELIAANIDTFDFGTSSDMYGITRYAGQDSLTGREVVIDGVTLLETAYDLTAYAEDGSEIWSARGNEFISPEWRMFLSGTGVTTTTEGQVEHDDRPVEFIFPGEPGFLSTRPKHGCGVAISSAPLSEETTYDYL